MVEVKTLSTLIHVGDICNIIIIINLHYEKFQFIHEFALVWTKFTNFTFFSTAKLFYMQEDNNEKF